MKIGKIEISNFKHIDYLLLDFTAKDLVVLDGPNGFGKTTVFDAIELVLTGKISRIRNTVDGRVGYSDILLAKDSNRDIEIKIEFKNNQDSIVIAKKFDSKKRLTNAEKKPDNWSIFDTYKLQSIDSDIDSDGQIINNLNIEEILGIKDLERHFSLFYYVQQEENTLFLKQDAKRRMDEISQLFDTYEEENELRKFESMYNKLNSEIRKISGPNGELIKKREQLKIFKEGLSQIEDRKIEEVEYFRLINSELPINVWDRELKTINSVNREKYLDELRRIYYLRKNLNNFIWTENNNYIYKTIENKKLISDILLYFNFLEKFEQIKQKRELEINLKNIRLKLTKSTLRKELNYELFERINGLLPLTLNLDEIKAYISELREYSIKMGDLSNLIRELNETRKLLLSQFTEIQNEEILECPLCGKEYSHQKILAQKIEEKTLKFSEIIDEDSKKFTLIFETFYEKYVNYISSEIENYLNVEENQIDPSLYNGLIESIKNKSTIINLIKWFEEKNINIENLINQKFMPIIDIEDKTQEIINLMLLRIKSVDEKYTNHSNLKTTFSTVFNDSYELLNSVMLEDIVKKSKYIDFRYFNSDSLNVEILNREIFELESKNTNLSLIAQDLKSVIEIFKENILDHWKKIIRDIEIPFYIYSGKIIQNYQRGCGLFMFENESYGQKSIRFVSDMKSEHDAVNYLSSGQLAGLVISFTLALNKVYGDNSIQVLLIDDPVQSMDEINIASLTELIRNEFKDKQLILSTHEEDVSRYIRYKFSKYNLETSKINIKEKIYLNS